MKELQIGSVARAESTRTRRTQIPPLVRQERDGPPPLSFAQERLWFLDQLGLVGPAYNIPCALRMEGELNVPALERSFAELIRRHESLRTHFELIAGTPIQIIESPGPFCLSIQDLSQAPERERDHAWRRLSREEAQSPFDLKKGPLLRASLLRLAPREHVLLFTIHHIAADGWSLGIFNRELGTLYGAFCRGEPSPLPDLAVQYADYAIWQRRCLTGDVLESQLRYWRDQLQGVPLQLPLPTDRTRPAVASFKGDIHIFELPASLCRRLERLARAEQATLFMVLLAAFQIILGRYSGQSDVAVGSACAGRTNPQTEGLIGFFVNTVVLRTDLRGNPSFRSLLCRVKETVFGAFAHQDLPFEKLVKELHPERSLTRQPLFQVALALQNVPQEALELPGLKWTRLHVEQGTALFDLTLQLFEDQGGLRGELEYTTDLYDRSTVERMAGHFHTLLEQIAADPDISIEQISLLRPREQRLLLEWAGPTVTINPRDDVVSVLERNAEEFPEEPAVSYADRLLTYAGLNACANRIARDLLDAGVKSGEYIGVYVPRGLECLIAFYAILKVGAVYVPLDRVHPAERLNWMCRDSGIRRVVVKAGERNETGLVIDQAIEMELDSLMTAALDSIENINCAVEGSSPAYAIYTSGSTGTPKGAVLHRLGLANVVSAQRNIFRLRADDRVVQFSSFSFDASVMEFMLALGAHACLVCGTTDDLRPGQALAEFFRRHEISATMITPSALLSLSSGDVPSLRVLIVGGEEVPADLVRTWGRVCEVFNAYGPTEATIFVTTHACSTQNLDGRVPIGKAIDNTQIYLLNSALRPIAIGEIGELCAGGIPVGLGYINRPELMAERFIEDPRIGPGRIYRTGDLARWRSDGTLEYLGRIDDQTKIRGYRIEPAEIEAVLQDHPAVKQATVLAREDVPGERRLVAYVVGDRIAATAAGAECDSEELRKEIVGEWKTLYEGTYGAVKEEGGPSFVGWNSSYTGEPIPEPQIQEWLARTVDRIQELKPKRALEIGCGVGLILQHLAPQCETYVGTDFSAVALEGVRRWISGRSDLKHVQLHQRSAIDLGDLQPGSFDTVVLNSVVQYFPDLEYLIAVLREAVRVVEPGGRIFIGDVRHLGLLQTFHSAIQLAKAAATVTVGQLRKRIARAVAQEKELLIDPQFFRVLPRRLSGIGGVEVHLKRGHSQDEMTRYRYDVVMHIGERFKSELQPKVQVLDWRSVSGSLTGLASALAERRWSAVYLTSIPNARLAIEAEAQRLIDTTDERLDAGALRRQVKEISDGGINPEAIFKLGEAHGFDVHATWETNGAPERFEAQLYDRTRVEASKIAHYERPEAFSDSWTVYANDPLGNALRRQLPPQLREHLKRRLPEYMVPSGWVVLDQLPLTPSGKVDRRALPPPEDRPEEMGEYVAPRTDIERVLADIWAELLHVDQVGVIDNFFELGGHSLLAVKLTEAMGAQLNVRLPVSSLFKHPTIAEIAVQIEPGRAKGQSYESQDDMELESGVL